MEEVSLRLLDAAAASVGRWHVKTSNVVTCYASIIFFLYVTMVIIIRAIATAAGEMVLAH